MHRAAEFLKARDFLLAHRTDYESALQEFHWPKLDEFNWALDYFDPMAKDNHRIALWIVDEDGVEVRLTFADLSERSNRLANYLRSVGVRRGRRILVMLGNEAALWETMLAAMKLGAVVIPTTGLLGPEDLHDRLHRGHVGYVIANASHAEKVGQALSSSGVEIPHISVGGGVAGCTFFWRPQCRRNGRSPGSLRRNGHTRLENGQDVVVPRDETELIP